MANSFQEVIIPFLQMNTEGPNSVTVTRPFLPYIVMLMYANNRVQLTRILLKSRTT